MFLIRWIVGFWKRLKAATGTGGPLCDTCKYDYGDACTRPERPNARTCGDYRMGS